MLGWPHLIILKQERVIRKLKDKKGGRTLDLPVRNLICFRGRTAIRHEDHTRRTSIPIPTNKNNKISVLKYTQKGRGENTLTAQMQPPFGQGGIAAGTS